jgi:hypothetical protein
MDANGSLGPRQEISDSRVAVSRRVMAGLAIAESMLGMRLAVAPRWGDYNRRVLGGGVRRKYLMHEETPVGDLERMLAVSSSSRYCPSAAADFAGSVGPVVAEVRAWASSVADLLMSPSR